MGRFMGASAGCLFEFLWWNPSEEVWLRFSILESLECHLFTICLHRNTDNLFPTYLYVKFLET